MPANAELLRQLGVPNANVKVVESSNRHKDETPESAATDEAVVAHCFGYLRGQRDRSVNLELRRLKEGDSVAFPYSWLGPCRFDPSVGVLLVFAGGELYGVRIRGRNLNLLLEEGFCLYDRGILRHRVTFVREMSREECRRAHDGECVVERIEIEGLQADQLLNFLGVKS